MSGTFEELSLQECHELLGTTSVGRVAFVGSDGQQLLPVNFAFRADAIYLRTSPYGPMAELARGVDDVAFEVDYHSESQPIGWSVLVKGASSGVDDDEEIAKLRSGRRPAPWAPGTRSLHIRITPRSITGRRVGK